MLDKAKALFFVDEKCVFGNLKDVDIILGNFREEAVNDKDFISLADYIRTASLSKTRLYLLIKNIYLYLFSLYLTLTFSLQLKPINVN